MKYDFKKILDKIDELLAEDDKLDDLIKALFAHVAPSSYPPFVERSSVHSFLKAFSILDESLREELHYYAFEAHEITLKDGTVFDIRKKEEALAYLNLEFNK